MQEKVSLVTHLIYAMWFGAVSVLLTPSIILADDKTEDLPSELPHRDPSGRGTRHTEADVPKELLHTMKPIDVPIFKDGEHLGYLGITITWKGKEAASMEDLKALEPRLRDMVITDLYAALYLLWKPGFLPSKQLISKRLLTSAQKVAPDLIDDVFTREYYLKKKHGR